MQSECQWESKLVSQTVILRLNTVHIVRTSSSTPGHSGFSLSVDSDLQICLLISILPTKINTCGTFCGYLQTCTERETHIARCTCSQLRRNKMTLSPLVLALSRNDQRTETGRMGQCSVRSSGSGTKWMNMNTNLGKSHF